MHLFACLFIEKRRDTNDSLTKSIDAMKIESAADEQRIEVCTINKHT
jgi:hypothetical protein